mmetsp:Transcript_39512/g.45153  ORF Transcript_39512/g.45153 Transcript_39512/m.45153 type:complete len:83 (-) Transcript_39512:125-373(-)
MVENYIKIFNKDTNGDDDSDRDSIYSKRITITLSSTAAAATTAASLAATSATPTNITAATTTTQSNNNSNCQIIHYRQVPLF